MPKVKYNMVYSKIQKCLGKISIISGYGFHPFPVIMNIFANQFGFFENTLKWNLFAMLWC